MGYMVISQDPLITWRLDYYNHHNFKLSFSKHPIIDDFDIISLYASRPPRGKRIDWSCSHSERVKESLEIRTLPPFKENDPSPANQKAIATGVNNSAI